MKHYRMPSSALLLLLLSSRIFTAMKILLNARDYIPFFANQFVEDDSEDIEFDYQAYNDLINSNRARLHGFEKYISRLHDSWIKGVEVKDDSMRISLNDFDTHVFADALLEKHNLKIKHEALNFPLVLNFSGNLSYRAYTVVDGSDGDLKPMYIGTLNEELPKTQQYLYEQILELDAEHIKMAFALWNWEGKYLILEVSANNFTLEENQEQNWNAVFEGKYQEELEYFENLRFSAYQDMGIAQCRKILSQYYAEQGK